MNEKQARRVLLVRAFETVDTERRLLSDDDRRYAARVADEMVRWQSKERVVAGGASAPEAYLEKRAELLLAKLAERVPAVSRIVQSEPWPAWLGTVLPALAFAIGFAVDTAVDGKRISIVAFPLLGLIAWNLVAYCVMAVHKAQHLAARMDRQLNLVARWMGGLRGRLSGAGKEPLVRTALEAFHDDWTRKSMRLAGLRVARVWHLSAAFLAAGALFGLYVRGLAFEYRAGWESTFLGAEQVHLLLSTVLGPFAAVIKSPFPSVGEIAALEWGAGGNGENAARWIYLYAVAMFALVILPRIGLAWFDHYREDRAIERFPIALDEPYFRRLLGSWGAGPVRLRVWPYSYTLDESAARGLRAIAKRAFGDVAELVVMPTVKFGGEDGFRAAPQAAAAGRSVEIVLFAITATPEAENHGRFVREARAQLPGARVWIDETPYRRKLGSDPAAKARLEERRRAWIAFVAAHGAEALALDLGEPDLAALEEVLHGG